MPFSIDGLRNSLSNTGKQAAKKARDLTDSVQLKSQIASEKAALNKLYTAIGQQVFEGAAPEDEEKYAAQFDAIRQNMDRINELEEHLASLDNGLYCANCGAKISKKALYCSQCGAKIERAQAEADLEAAMEKQMEGTKEEEQNLKELNSEIDIASASATPMDGSINM